MKQLPNLLTLSNLFCGILACILVIKGFYPNLVLVLLCCSLVFDFFDGFVARAVKASGPIGKELDSLADVVSFGLLPGLLMFSLLGGNIVVDAFLSGFSFPFEKSYRIYFSFLGLLITLFSAYRLAKFNLDEEQTYYFKGLNTPSFTLLVFSLYWVIVNNPASFWNNMYLLLAITLLGCYLLISDIPMLSLKFKKFGWKGNELVFILLIIAFLGIIFFQIKAIPFIILFYIILSIIFKSKIISKKPQS